MLASGLKKDRNILKIATSSTIDCTIEELDRIIGFLEYAKAEFSSELRFWEENNMQGYSLQLHYRDWYAEWTKNESDFTVDIFENKNKELRVMTIEDAERSFAEMSEFYKSVLREWEEEDRQMDAAEER